MTTTVLRTQTHKCVFIQKSLLSHFKPIKMKQISTPSNTTIKMIIITFVMVCSSLLGFSQTPLYNPDFDRLQRAMNIKSTQYENGVHKIAEAYSDLRDLTIVNTENLEILNKYRDAVKEGLKKVSKWDLSVPSNVSTAVNYVNRYLEVPSIKAEKKLLSGIEMEMWTLKRNHPDDFSTLPRFKEIVALMEEIKNCPRSEIESIGIKHGFFAF